MQNYKRNIFVFFAVLVVSTATIVAALRSQSQDPKGPTSRALEKAKEDFHTITDYEISEPADLQKRALRRARAKRYNLRPEKGVDPKRFIITEERESSFGGPSSHAPNEPALPAAQSDAVVIGEVTGAQAFMTEDKTSILSEFTVRITDILKTNLATLLSPGDSIDTIRGGGAVRFPSGKIIRIGHGGKPHPRIGRRYVFFLKYNDEGQDFSILTAYELREGRVFPLDGLDIDGSILEPYAAYQKYKNADEASFLNAVGDAIACNLSGTPVVWRHTQ